MQKGHSLQINCQSCNTHIHFSIFGIEKNEYIKCPECGLQYDFSDETLKRQLKKFEKLCRQLKESEEILANTSVGIYVTGKQIEIPYNLLLSRLNSTLNLMIGNKPIKVTFRIEPAVDTPMLENYSQNPVECK